ncbi:hypothetical protein Tco_1566126, partial [Tanacetum coccineum]
DEPIIIQDAEEEEVDADKAGFEKTQDTKLKKEKSKVEAEVALLSALPRYPNVEHLTDLLVKSLKLELSKLLSSHLVWHLITN